MPDESTRVELLDTDDVVFTKIILKRGGRAKVRRDAARLADNKSLDPRAARLDILEVYAVVTDERIGHADDLPGIARVGQDLLVARHRRVKDHLAKCLTR